MFRVTLANWLKKHPGIRQTMGRFLASVPPSFRMGKRFWFWYSFFRESEQWPVDRMMAYQVERLRNLLGELSQASAFYRERLKEVDIARLDSIERFSALVPILNGNEFKINFDSILSHSWRKQKLTRSQTSGTTGKALQFYHTSEDSMREWAAICHQWSRVGYLPGKSRRAEFRGLTPADRLVDVFPERNMIRCSILDLKVEHVRYYAEAIRSHGIDFYHGYPSALHLLSSVISHHGIDFPHPKGILLASEEIHDWQLDAIQFAFPRAKLFAHYGCAERTVLAGWCEHKREYHALPQYAVVEVDKDTSEIIGTNLFNTVNGFVRYRMTDTVLEVDPQPCPDCGRPYIPRLVSLGGRSEDYLFSIEKGWIPPAVVTYPLKNLEKIQGIQFLQQNREKITVFYAPHLWADDEAIRRELHDIELGLRRLFGNATMFQFERVENFRRNQSGKYKWIINELDEARFESNA